MRNINEIIIHCSATDPDDNVTVNDIRCWHKKRGFNDIGYHFIIDLDGTIHKGRPLDVVGAHCKGHNRNSIGICYIGGISNGVSCDTRTHLQKLSLISLVEYLCSRYSIPFNSVKGHNEYANKDCPCFDVASFIFLKQLYN